MITNANRNASWALATFKDRSRDVMLPLHTSFIRSHLEFCCPDCSPHDISSIQRLKNIREFTRHIAGLQSLEYWGRLIKLNLMSLQRRRERYKMIHIWKILSKQTSNDIQLELTTSDRRGIRVKIRPIPKDASQAAETQGRLPSSRDPPRQFLSSPWSPLVEYHPQRSDTGKNIGVIQASTWEVPRGYP